MSLFFILGFFCSFFAVESIIFNNDIIFKKNLFVVNANIVGNNVAVNGGINCANSFTSEKVYLNTDLENANYLLISTNDSQVNMYIKNLPTQNALSYYLVIDPVSSLVYYFKPEDPQPTNLVADKILCNTIAGYNSDNLIINNMPGDTTIGNCVSDLYLASDTILIDGEVSSLADNIVFQSVIQPLDTLTVKNISANKFSFEKSASTASTIEANSFLIKNLVLNQGNTCSILAENQIAFQDSATTNELIFSNQDSNTGIIIKDLLINFALQGLLVFDPVAKCVSLFPINKNSLTLNDLVADCVTVISDIDVINNSFFINLSANTINFSSLSGSQNLVVNGNLNFGNQFSIKNKVILDEKASFLISTYASTVNLANNLTPIKANNFLVISELRDQYDLILLTINGDVKILYPGVTSLSNYTFLGFYSTGQLIQIPSAQNFLKNKMKLADIENFKKSFIPKIFQYKKEHSLDIDPVTGAEVKRFGLIVEDIEHFKHKNILKSIIEKDDTGKSINYNERIVAEMTLEQLNLMSKKLKDFKKIIIAEKNSLLKIKKLIEKLEFEINALSKE